MAEIFLARTKSLEGFEKYLVIKKILKNRTSDPDFVRMFLDEARLAATLDHPNIIQIYDVGQIDGQYFIAMEYLRGHNLIEVVRTGAKLGHSKPPLEHVISMVTSGCAGLHYAHEKRDFQGRPLEIVHRDVTPQNIVVSFDGAVKIVDFGIAKAATRQVDTMAGTLKGKIGYMSPEQCKGGNVDRRSDIFAVGIILFELTTGRRLYHERSDFETLKRIIEGPVPAPRELLPFYPAFLNAIVVRCLQKDPHDRYQTARELHSDLDAFARDNQLVTGTVPLSQYMERLYADELKAEQATEPPGLLATEATGASYLGEQARRTYVEAPFIAARRQHRYVRAAYVLISLLVLSATGLWGFRRFRPANAHQLAAVSEARLPVAPTPLVVVTPPAPSPAPVVVAAAPVLAPPTRSRAAAKPAEAHISIASSPMCEVMVDGIPYGTTPVIDIAVSPGKHLLTLLNSRASIRHPEKVNLSAGELWTRSFTWKDGKMAMSSNISPQAMASAPEAESATRPSAVPASKPAAAPITSKSILEPPPPARPKPIEGPAAATELAVAASKPAGEASPASKPSLMIEPGGALSTAPRTVANFILEVQKLSAPTPRLPDNVVRANLGRKLAGAYTICVGPDGHVFDVRPVTSIAGADANIIDGIKNWVYKPQKGRVCATKQLTFQVPLKP